MDIEVIPAPVAKSGRDEKGKFAKGNRFRPPGPTAGAGRPRKLDAIEVLESIVNTFTPDEVSDMLILARNIAVKNEDWKGVLEVARFVAAYAIGKPVTRAITVGGDLEDFRKLFQPRGEEEEYAGDDNGPDSGAS